MPSSKRSTRGALMEMTIVRINREDRLRRKRPFGENTSEPSYFHVWPGHERKGLPHKEARRNGVRCAVLSFTDSAAMPEISSDCDPREKRSGRRLAGSTTSGLVTSAFSCVQCIEASLRRRWRGPGVRATVRRLCSQFTPGLSPRAHGLSERATIPSARAQTFP